MSLVQPISLGQVVESIAGRDRREVYLVVALEGPYLLVANGRQRSVKAPKKKNKRHVRAHKRNSEPVRSALEAGESVSDEQVRQVLKNLCPDHMIRN